MSARARLPGEPAGAAPAARGPRRRHVPRLVLVAAAGALAMNPASGGADTLSGTVRDSSGAPVNNADFDVFDFDGDKLPFDGSSRTTGNYDLQIDPGRYDIVCQPPIGTGLAPQVRRGVLVGGSSRLDWTLPAAARLLGHVLGPGGRPLARAQLDFDRTDDGSRQPALGNLTNIFGSFAAYIAAGDYRVTAFPAIADTALAPTRLDAVHAPTGDTLKLILEPAVHISGTIRDAGGAPVPGAKLVFERAATRERVPAWGHVAVEGGAFRAGIAPGVYRLTVAPPRGLLVPARRVDDLDLTSDRAVDLTLPSGVVLSGHVRGSDGEPLAGADWDVADEATQTSVPTPFDNVDYDGNYTLALPAGLYHLTLSPPAGSGLDTLHFHDVSVTRDTVLDVDYGGTAPGPSLLRLLPLGNPTHRSAAFRLWLPASQRTRIELFDVVGRRVRDLVDANLPAGRTDLRWDGNDAAGNPARTGVYFVRALGPAGSVVARIVLLP